MGDGDLQALFGQRVREERTRRGYSQEEFAHLAGVDRTYLSGVERGTRNITLRVISQIADALDVPPIALVRASDVESEIAAAVADHVYLCAESVEITRGFLVTAGDIIAATHQTNAVMRALPLSLYRTIDLKTQSGIVGAIFSTELAARVGAIPNPIEKGHPDVVPTSAIGSTEAELRNYPEGLEIKSTLGSVAKGSDLRAGEARIDSLVNLVWQAHHRDVRSLMGLVWDFVGGTKSELRHPAVTGVFYSDELKEGDWGEISGTTGRNTKVTGMKVSGRRKMALGAVVVLDEAEYQLRYPRCLGLDRFRALTTRTS